MRKKLLAATLTFALLLCLYGILLMYINNQKTPMPIAADGVLDLSEWQWEASGTIRLDGEWELYQNNDSSFVQVPGSWTDDRDARGAATYRLRIFMNKDEHIFGVKVSSVQMANRLFINGQLVGESGNPTAGDNYFSLNKPYVSYFTLSPGWNEILLQVANYDFKASNGIQESIMLGYADEIAELREWALARDWIVMTAFLIMGLYFVGLYTQRRKDLSHIVFGIVCLFIALYTTVRGERIAFIMFGDLPFWLFYRLQVVSAFSVGIGFLLYVYTTFRPYCSRWIIRGGVGIGITFALLNIGFASQLTTEPWRIMTGYSTVCLVYATYVFVLAALHRIEGSGYLVVAALALNVMQLISNLNVYNGSPSYSLPPVEPFLVLLMLALLMSLRFSNAFRKIEELSEQLLMTDKLKDDFLARTSHEFKTPLHGIMNISRSMLDDKATAPDVQREKLELITDISRRLTQLVYDILDLSKLKRGELRLVTQAVDVRMIAEMQLRFYSHISKEKQLQLVNAVPEDLPMAMADESRLSQILSNLLDNAIKHTDQGSVTITGEAGESGLILSVQDTGKGIADEAIAFIFEEFKSLEQAGREGIGLGLPITKQLVELQGGTLTASSILGVGSVFTFTLPLASHDIPTVMPPAYRELEPKERDYSFVTPHHANPNGKYTILAVDDQHVNLKVLLDALDGLDYHVIAVKNGTEALTQLEQAVKIDLVILDLMMPGMSGLEVCQQIRERYSLLELPVLMVTAAIQPRDKVESFRAGANDYLSKPFDLEELRARIGSLLAMKLGHGRAVQMEVAFLQSQIKPHFLYNVLNSIVASSYRDVDQARDTIVDLASYLRGTFRFSNVDETILFAEEFELIQTYVQIERVRFRDRIDFEYDIEEGAYGIRIPPLLLQPLVENAIRHGIGDRLRTVNVKLSVRHEGEFWRITIADDGKGMASEQLSTLLDPNATHKGSGVGLLNIDRRLRYAYGRTLHVESKPDQGTIVTIMIPVYQERRELPIG